jgi:hypothetical protein
MTDQKKIIHDLKATLSRRDILLGSAATAFMAKSAWNRAVAKSGGSSGFVYVASGGGSVGDLNGIVTYSWDPSTGALDFVTFTPAPNGTTFFEINHAKNVLYVSNESGPGTGGVSSYTMNSDGSLTNFKFVLGPPTNTKDPLDPASGTLGGPSYVVLDTSKQYLLTASWGGFYAASYSLNSDGSLNALVDTIYYQGSLGPTATQQLGAQPASTTSSRISDRIAPISTLWAMDCSVRRTQDNSLPVPSRLPRRMPATARGISLSTRMAATCTRLTRCPQPWTYTSGRLTAVA